MCHAKKHRFLQYPKAKQNSIPFWSDALANYYREDKHDRQKEKHLAPDIKSGTKSDFIAFLEKTRKRKPR
jgi:hypothetical protein